MRRLIVTENMSFDGVVSPLGGWFHPSEAEDDELTRFTAAQSRESDGMILGRVTFEEFRGYWPDHADEPGGIGEYLSAVEKHVVSRTLVDPGWVNTTIHAGDPVDEIADLKQQEGRDLALTGSVSLVHTLLDAGLVDEVRVMLYPAVQGEGRRLFPAGPLRHLRPVDGRVFPSGVVYAAYDVRSGG